MSKNAPPHFPPVGRSRPLSLLRQTLNRVFLALSTVQVLYRLTPRYFLVSPPSEMVATKCMTNEKGADNK